MSIKTITVSFKKFLKQKSNFKLKNIQKTRALIDSLDFVISNASVPSSLKFTKKIVLLCNHNIHKDDGSKLLLAEDSILSWIRSAKSLPIKIPESLVKLLIITYINQSLLYQFVKPSKSVEAVIKAIKLSQKFVLKSRKGKLLKFNSMLRLCQLYIFLKKPEQGIMVAQQVLQGVLKKLENKRAKKHYKEFVMVAVTAFYRIAICEQMNHLKKSAEEALSNANSIISKYLPVSSKILNLDYEFLTARPLHFSQTSRSLKPAFEKINSASEENLSKQSLNSPTINIPQTSRKASLPKITENEKPLIKFPERYYSKDRLEKLEKMLRDEKKPSILNTDNFFFKKISKNLAIHGDLKATALNIRKNVNNQLMDVWKNKEMLKKKKKKAHFMTISSVSEDKIQDKIGNLQEHFESRLKVQDVKMKSKLKTKIYKKLLRSINVPVKSSKNFPNQRLFFRPPEKRINTVSTLLSKSGNTGKFFEDAKHEIEEQMEELKQDIKGVAVKQALPRKKEISKLAESTIKQRASVLQIRKCIIQSLLHGSIKDLGKKK